MNRKTIFSIFGMILVFVLAAANSTSNAQTQQPSIGNTLTLVRNSPLSNPASFGQIAYANLTDEAKLALFDVDSHALLGTIDLAAVGCKPASEFSLTPNGNELYILCPDSGNLTILDVATQTKIAAIPHEMYYQFNNIVFTADGAYALTTFGSTTEISVIDTTTHTIVKTITVPPSFGFTTHPKQNLAYTLGDHSLYVIDTTTFSLSTTVPIPFADAWGMVVSPDGKWLYISDRSGGGVAKIDASSYQVIGTLPIFSDLFTIRITPDGTRLYVGELWGGKVFAIDAVNLTLLDTIQAGGYPYEVGISCDGKKVFVGNYTSSIPVIDVKSNQIIENIPISSPTRWVVICPPFSDLYPRKTVDKAVSRPGDFLTYTLSTKNFLPENVSNVVITDTLPATLVYQTGSLSASSGSAIFNNGVIRWTGTITASQSVTLTYGAKVADSAPMNVAITNTAMINFQNNKKYSFSTSTMVVPYFIYLPCSIKPCQPTLVDDFADPASGWPQGKYTNAHFFYINGEYQVFVKPAGHIAFVYVDAKVSDYSVEVDVHPASHLHGGLAIIFGLNDNGFYEFRVSRGYYSLVVNYYTYWSTLIGWTPSPAIFNDARTNRLKVVRRGVGIELYANGKLLTSTSNDLHTGTYIGFGSESYAKLFDGRFDNFLVNTGRCINMTYPALSAEQIAPFRGIMFEQATADLEP